MKIPDNVKEVLGKGHTVWVATMGADGWPNVAAKGSGGLVDDEHIYFADLYSKKTRDNLLNNPRVAVGIHSVDPKLAVQVKGTAKMVDAGEFFDKVQARISSLNMGLPPIKYVVEIKVESVWDMSGGANAGEPIT
ncbi:MAG TPA: pyridoxamine 5'-phosphate oxidase family protein [Armatimonadota bacterium]